MTPITPAPRPTVEQSLDAQKRTIPLSVTTGVAGYRIAHADGDYFQSVSVPVAPHVDRPLYWSNPFAAHEAMRKATFSTAALLARVFPKAGAL